MTSGITPGASFDSHTTGRRFDASASVLANALSPLGAHVREDRRVEHDELGVGRRLGEHGRKIVHQVAGPDRSRIGPGDADGRFEPMPSRTVIRPHARLEPPNRVIVVHVDRMQIQTTPPGDPGQGRGERSGPRHLTAHVNGRGRSPDARRSEPIGELIEPQAEARARAHFDERQGSGREGREQDRTTADLVRLRPARPHDVRDLRPALLSRAAAALRRSVACGRVPSRTEWRRRRGSAGPPACLR